jgi:biotin carboxylase
VLTAFSVPALPGLRVDTHCAPGVAIPPFYDSLMAKLIAHADERSAALALLADALAETEVEGVLTNRELLVELLRHPQLRDGAVTTDWLAEVLR